MEFAITFSVKTLLLSFLFILGADAAGRLGLSKEEDLELERQLRVINKPAVKSFKTRYGAIIDCIDMYKQHAFDHPMLKNHTIQMEPEHIPKGPTRKPRGMAPFFQLDNQCPEGTVPVIRATKEDLLIAKYIPRHPGNHSQAAASPNTATGQGLRFAMMIRDRTTLGVKGNIGAWAPTVLTNQLSLATISLASGSGAEMINVQAGWMSYNYLYPNSTRVYIYWTADGYQKTGCYNLLCPGFIQVSSIITVGLLVHPSTYGGDLMALRFTIIQDSYKGHWWLTINDEKVGYWPRDIVKSLVRGAERVAWGGQVFSPPGTPAPEMGSGHFPSEGLRKAASITNLRVSLLFSSSMFVDPDHDISIAADKPNCYKATTDKTDENGRYILYGDPSGCTET